MFPKYAISNAWPDDPHSWIVRLRNPFLAALVEERGLIGMHLHCWPASVEHAIAPRKLARIIADMAAIWGEEIEHLSGLPSAWSFSFDEKFAPPEFMVIDGAQGTECTGILQPARGILWMGRDVPSGGISWRWVREFGGEPEFPADIRAVAEYYRRFCELEDQMTA